MPSSDVVAAATTPIKRGRGRPRKDPYAPAKIKGRAASIVRESPAKVQAEKVVTAKEKAAKQGKSTEEAPKKRGRPFGSKVCCSGEVKRGRANAVQLRTSPSLMQLVGTLLLRRMLSRFRRRWDDRPEARRVLQLSGFGAS